MGNADINQRTELEKTLQDLRRQLEEEKKTNPEMAEVMEKTIAETEKLAKNLQETSSALDQERQYALQRAERERLLSRWVERINSSFDLNQVLAESIQELGEFIHADRCGVILFNGEESDDILHEYSTVLWLRDFDKAKVVDNHYIQQAISRRSSYAVEKMESSKSDDFTDRVKSFLLVPLVTGEDLVGIIYAQQCSKERSWTKRDIELLETTSLPLTTAIEKTRLYDQAKSRSSQEELLNRLTTRIRSSLNLEDILSRTVKELGIALNVSRCFLYANGAISHEYCKYGVRSIAEESKSFLLDKLSPDTTISDPIVINDLTDLSYQERLSSEERAELKMSEAKAALAIPLYYQDTLHGWLVFHSIEEREWTFEDVDFVESVASQVIVAITQSTMYEKLNAYQERISRELKQAARVQTSLIGGDVFDANLEASVFYKAHSNVSGDFYWIAELSPHIVGVLIGDVSGKGPAAALLTGYLLGEFNSMVANSSMAWHPGKMINFLCKSALYQNSSSDFYATAWYGVYDLRTGEVRYCNAGHLNPYLYQGGKIELMDEEKDAGIPLGLIDPKDLDEAYEVRTINLDPGDKMILFTDGVLDQKMPNGEFVPKDWLIKEIDKHKTRSVKEITYELNNKLNELSGDTPLSDDRLVVCLEQTKFEIKEFNAEDPKQCEDLIIGIIEECAKHGMNEDKIVDLKLGLIEAITNAVRYGLNKNPYGKIELGFKVTEGSFKMSIIDPGPGFNWQMYNHVDIDEVGLEEEGGRGIPLLREIFDKVTWNPAGNQIGLFFYW